MTPEKVRGKDNLYGIDEYEVTILRELLRKNKSLRRKDLVIYSAKGLSRSLAKLVRLELIRRDGFYYTLESSGIDLLKKIVMYGRRGWEKFSPVKNSC